MKYLLGPANKGHGASKVLFSFAKDYNLEYVTFYSIRGILLWLNSIVDRRPVIYAPSVSRFQHFLSPGYLRDIVFIFFSTLLFPFRNHPIYFYNSQINFKSNRISPFLYRLISKRILIGPARPLHVLDHEILYYYSESMVVNANFSYDISKNILVWHLGYSTREKGWHEFKKLSKESKFKFMYAGRSEVIDISAEIIDEVPAKFVGEKYVDELNLFLFLSESDLFPLVVIEAINNGFVVVTIKNTFSELILDRMFRGQKCFLSIESIDLLSTECLEKSVVDIQRALNEFRQVQLLSRKYG